ncbi:MAG TPA: hypothetical protein VLJ15_08115 [Gammaproteobacteria bacterium]|nr:hypothetical protein [Gammaproteobacteria bacterium]
MPLSEMDRRSIDSVIAPSLDELYSLPPEDALAALSVLSQLPVMRPNEMDYPPLSPLFQKEVYQTIKVQDALRELSEIMRNRQPQGRTPHAERHRPVNWGKFSLIYSHVTEETKQIGEQKIVVLHAEEKSRSGKVITAEDVHDYMRYKFSIAKLNVIALHETQKFINQLKKDPELKKEYELHFAKWVSSDKKEIREAMQTFLLSDGMLKRKIAEALKTHLDQSNSDFQKSIPDVDGFIEQFFLLEPATFDREMSETLSFLSSGFFFIGGKQVKWEILKTPSYKSIREKLKAQAKDPDEHYSYDVISSFLKVAELQEKLNSVGVLLDEHHPKLAAECKRIIKDYIPHLENISQDEQKPLSKNDFLILDQSIEIINESYEFNDFVKNFFANYFATNDETQQDELFKKLFYYAFERKLLHIGDNWIDVIEKAHPEEKNYLFLDPQHRNQVFLHALTLPVEKWTPVFYETFNKIFSLLCNANDNDLRDKQYSYPPDMVNQLRWLKDRYISLQTQGKLANKLDSNFPLLYYPRSDLDLHRLTRLLGTLKKEAFFEIHWGEMFGKDLRFLGHIISHINPDQILILSKCIKNQLLILIENTDKLSSLVYGIGIDNHDKRKAFNESIKDFYPKLVKNAYDVNEIARYLFPDDLDYFFDSIDNQLQGLINHSYDFENIFRTLDPQRKTILFEKIKDKVPGFILSGNFKSHNFNRIFTYLDERQKASIFEMLKNNISDIIPATSDFHTIARTLKHLDSSQINFVFEKCVIRLNASEFEVICEGMNQKQRDALFESMKSTFLSESKIRTARELGAICRYLDPSQIDDFCRRLDLKPPALLDGILKSCSDLRNVFEKVNKAEQKAVIFEYIKNRLGQIVQSDTLQVEFILREFPEHKTTICHALIIQIGALIESRRDLLKYMDIFQEEKPDLYPFMLEVLRWKLPAIIQDEGCLRQFDERQEKAILDWLLINVLENYINERSHHSDYSRFNKFAYSAADKIDAAIRLKSVILNGEPPLEQKQVGALLQGDLCKEINKHFARYRPFQEGESLKDFLNAKMQSSAEHKPGPS